MIGLKLKLTWKDSTHSSTSAQSKSNFRHNFINWSVEWICYVGSFNLNCHAVTEFHFKSNLKIFVSQKVSHVKLLNQPIFILSLSFSHCSRDDHTNIMDVECRRSQLLIQYFVLHSNEPKLRGRGKEREKESKWNSCLCWGVIQFQISRIFSRKICGWTTKSNAPPRPNFRLFAALSIVACLLVYSTIPTAQTTTKQKINKNHELGLDVFDQLFDVREIYSNFIKFIYKHWPIIAPTNIGMYTEIE